jgi:hypothetical protein
MSCFANFILKSGYKEEKENLVAVSKLRQRW